MSLYARVELASANVTCRGVNLDWLRRSPNVIVGLISIPENFLLSLIFQKEAHGHRCRTHGKNRVECQLRATSSVFSTTVTAIAKPSHSSHFSSHLSSRKNISLSKFLASSNQAFLKLSTFLQISSLSFDFLTKFQALFQNRSNFRLNT